MKPIFLVIVASSICMLCMQQIKQPAAQKKATVVKIKIRTKNTGQ